MMVIRLPLYVIGFYNGYECSSVKKPGKPYITSLIHLVLIVISLLFIIWAEIKIGDIWMAEYGIWWYPWIIITVPLCLVLCRFLEATKKYKINKSVIRVLSFWGSISLELYLRQWIVTGNLIIYLGKYINKILLCIISIPLTIIVAWIYSRVFLIGGKKHERL